MKRTIVLIVMIAFGFNLWAQETREEELEASKARIEKMKTKDAEAGDDKISPDYRLDEEVQKRSGKDAKAVHIMCSLKQLNGKTHAGSSSFVLNKGVKYRFTTGNLKDSDGIVVLEFYQKKERTIKKIGIPPGEFADFEFECKETGKYRLRSSIENGGKLYEVTVISKVTQ